MENEHKLFFFFFTLVIGYFPFGVGFVDSLSLSIPLLQEKAKLIDNKNLIIPLTA